MNISVINWFLHGCALEIAPILSNLRTLPSIVLCCCTDHLCLPEIMLCDGLVTNGILKPCNHAIIHLLSLYIFPENATLRRSVVFGSRSAFDVGGCRKFLEHWVCPVSLPADVEADFWSLNAAWTEIWLHLIRFFLEYFWQSLTDWMTVKGGQLFGRL